MLDRFTASTQKNNLKIQCQFWPPDYMGVSLRTGIPSRSPVSSAIRDHYIKCKSDFEAENFSILDSASDATQLRILESMYIVESNPEMNDTTSAAPLYFN